MEKEKKNGFKKEFIKQIKPMSIGLKVILCFFGIVIYGIALKWFVYPSNILPTGFTGLSYLLQKLVNSHFHVLIPITVFNMSINAIPAICCFLIVGKAYTLASFVIMFSFSFIADYIPYMQLTKDPMVCAIFGGILCGYGGSLWFRCGVSGGGSDFISMSISSKFHIQPFNAVMTFNISLIIIQGILYGWEYSFYSIIYQFIMTQTINMSYRHYEARTIFIITDNVEEITTALLEGTGHSLTMFDGFGCYSKKNKKMLYTVVTQPELRKVINIIKKNDPLAFINVIKSSDIQGNFKYLPINKDDVDALFS